MSPGFHKPRKLAFKYLKVSFAPFLEDAKKQITEEQIEEAYQKDVSQGLHKVQELPAEPEKKESAEATPEKNKNMTIVVARTLKTSPKNLMMNFLRKSFRCSSPGSFLNKTADHSLIAPHLMIFFKE